MVRLIAHMLHFYSFTPSQNADAMIWFQLSMKPVAVMLDLMDPAGPDGGLVATMKAEEARDRGIAATPFPHRKFLRRSQLQPAN